MVHTLPFTLQFSYQREVIWDFCAKWNGKFRKKGFCAEAESLKRGYFGVLFLGELYKDWRS